MPYSGQLGTASPKKESSSLKELKEALDTLRAEWIEEHEVVWATVTQVEERERVSVLKERPYWALKLHLSSPYPGVDTPQETITDVFTYLAVPPALPWVADFDTVLKRAFRFVPDSIQKLIGKRLRVRLTEVEFEEIWRVKATVLPLGSIKK